MTYNYNDVGPVSKRGKTHRRIHENIDQLGTVSNINGARQTKRIKWIILTIVIVCIIIIILGVAIGVPLILKSKQTSESTSRTTSMATGTMPATISNKPVSIVSSVSLSFTTSTISSTFTTSAIIPTSTSVLINSTMLTSVTSNTTTILSSSLSSTDTTTTTLISITSTSTAPTTLTISETTSSLIISQTTTTTSSTSSSTTTTTATTSTTSTTTTTRTTTTSTRTTTTTSVTTTTAIPGNLLINPGAEFNLTGWTQMCPATAICDTGGLINSGYNPRSGRGMFAGGFGSGGSSAGLTQIVNLLGGAQNFGTAQLDAGKLKVIIVFYYQTYQRQLLSSDEAQVIINFRSTTNAVLGTVNSGLKICAPSPGWCSYSNVIALPVHTRSIEYTMKFIRNGGTDIDSYIDDNSLRII